MPGRDPPCRRALSGRSRGARLRVMTSSKMEDEGESGWAGMRNAFPPWQQKKRTEDSQIENPHPTHKMSAVELWWKKEKVKNLGIMSSHLMRDRTLFSLKFCSENLVWIFKTHWLSYVKYDSLLAPEHKAVSAWMIQIMLPVTTLEAFHSDVQSKNPHDKKIIDIHTLEINTMCY